MYAIVDIETTGGFAAGHRIIEVAILISDGKQVVEEFETLVNPERPIPLHITALTGIDDTMVAEAPAFGEVAEKILEMTADRIFVAHNVNFDYSFLQEEFSRVDMTFQRKKLCTVRTSRKLMPHLPSYSLGRLCHMLEIENPQSHRAKGDARAATELLHLLIQKDPGGIIDQAIKRNSKEALLPPNLPKADYEALPGLPGVYYFKNAKGKIIYVGKAKNLKKRVTSHFSGRTTSWQRQNFMREIHSISFDLAGSEFLALLLEAHQIRKYWPAYNRAQKTLIRRWGIVRYEDRSGLHRLGIKQVKSGQKVLTDFLQPIEARNFLWEKARQHQLCPKLCGLTQMENACAEYPETCQGLCSGLESEKEHNEKVEKTVREIENNLASFAILGSGRSADERSVVMVEEGAYLGFGYFPAEEEDREWEFLKNQLEPYTDNRESRSIISSYLRKVKEEDVIFLEG